MGRPINPGMKFFTISTDIFHNRKIQRLLRAKGHGAGLVFIATLCKIYAVNGYYAEINENLFLDIGVVLGLDEHEVAEIIRCCIDMELFDKPSVLNKNILTSYGIQQQHRYAHKRSKHSIDPALAVEEWMDTGLPLFNNGIEEKTSPIMYAETPVSAAITPVSAAISAHTDMIVLTRDKNLINYEEKDKSNRTPVKKPTPRKKPVQPIRTTDDARWAELQRLAADATGDRGDD